MQKPLISVIVPVYNTSKYLSDCVDSILKQTYPNIEIILVDDGSTDGSSLICDNLAGENHNVICIHQANAGVGSARNLGLDTAKGEYISFCDSDDIIMPNMIETLYSMVVKSDADMGVCSVRSTVSDTSVEATSDNCEFDIIDRDKMIAKVIYERNGYLWNKLFKRSIIGTMRMSKDLHYMEDELFVLQYLLKISRVACTEEGFYIYRDNPDSIRNVKLSNKRLTMIMADERIYDLLVDNGIESPLQTKVWNDLIKAYAISIKKIMMSRDKTFQHWKQYIKDGYNKYKSRNDYDNSWNTKEKAYLIFLKIYALT